MQTTIHGADNLVTSSKSDSKEWPPILEQDRASSDEDEDTEPRLNMMASGALKENHNGLYWLDGPSPNLDNVEHLHHWRHHRCQFIVPFWPSWFNFANCSNGTRSAHASSSSTTSTNSDHTKRGQLEHLVDYSKFALIGLIYHEIDN